MLQSILNDPGYVQWFIGEHDLTQLRKIVKKSFDCLITEFFNNQCEKLTFDTLDEYNSKNFSFDHSVIFSKKSRCIQFEDIEAVFNLKFYQKIVSDFGVRYVSDEENLGRPNIYWRIVRSDSPTDVGPFHADSWFWDLGHGKIGSNERRIKIWIPLFQEQGKSGFGLVPNSHKENFEYGSVFKDGILKPTFDETKIKDRIVLLDSKPGTAVLFNDNLLHGGIVGGNKTRVSIEFTLVTSV